MQERRVFKAMKRGVVFHSIMGKPLFLKRREQRLKFYEPDAQRMRGSGQQRYSDLRRLSHALHSL